MSHPKGDVWAMLAPHLGPGMTVIDVGANTGTITRQIADVVGPTGHVIAVEPDPRCWPALDRLPTPPVSVLPAACGHRVGTAPLFQGRDASRSSLYRAAVEVETPDSIVTPIVRLDDVHDPDTVDAIKIDAQGAEARILDGAPRLMRRCPVWVVELWPDGLAAAGCSVLDVFDRFDQNDYALYWGDGVRVAREKLLAWLTSGQVYVNVRAVKVA
jgi:FkbM family methyltransferase